MLRSREQRQVLAELELTSVSRARAFVPVVTTSGPSSSPPTGDDTPASYWRSRFDEADPGDVPALVELARGELAHIRRRPFPAVEWASAEELAERVVTDGEGFDPLHVSIALRCTPTFVRRSRLARGREAERGRKLRLDLLDPRALVDAGMSIRQASAVSGVPRSTLASRLARCP